MSNSHANAPLQPGDEAPDFALPNQDGEIVCLSDLSGRRVVLYFYPEDDTSGCTAQARGFKTRHAEVEAANAIVLGVSPDDEASHRRFRDKLDLPFPLLVDADHSVAEAYGVWQPKKIFGKEYLGIVRSHFVIGPDGRIEQAEVKVRPADSVERALSAVAG